MLYLPHLWAEFSIFTAKGIFYFKNKYNIIKKIAIHLYSDDLGIFDILASICIYQIQGFLMILYQPHFRIWTTPHAPLENPTLNQRRIY